MATQLPDGDGRQADPALPRLALGVLKLQPLGFRIDHGLVEIQVTLFQN